MHRRSIFFFITLSALTLPVTAQEAPERRWLAGDHHVHSIYSANYTPTPDAPISPHRQSSAAIRRTRSRRTRRWLGGMG